MSDKINVRQICFIMLAYTTVTKLIFYPTLLSFNSGRDLLFSAGLNFLVQAIIVWAVSYLCSRTDKTFFGLLEGTFGKIFARVIYGLFALFFLICTIVPLLEQKFYVHAIFYDTLPTLPIFLTFFFFAFYAASKGFTNIGRCADICLPIFIFTIVFILGLSVPEVNWENFLPILKTPLKDVFGSSLATVFRFAEPCYLLMFMGHFRYKKGDAAKITLSYIGGALTVLFFLTVFYGIYGDIACSRQYAISKISLFFSGMDIIGRVDLIMLYVLEIVMLFALVINVQMSVHCLVVCTDYNNRAVFSIALNAALMIFLIFTDNSFNAIHDFWSKWMWIAFVIFANIIPLAAWALKKGERRRADERKA